jgi:uncharacterized protein (DUF433 family)
MVMPKLVSTLAEAVVNIEGYAAAMARSEQVRKSAAYTKWWYAAQDKSGKWSFGPSKYIGYAGANSDVYEKLYNDGFHGSGTQRALSLLFVEVDPRSALHHELYAALEKFLARGGGAIGGHFRGFFVPQPVAAATSSAKRASEQDLLARITSDPDICSGRPCIRGTRMRVVDIMEMLASGVSHAEILEDFPDIEAEDIAAALLYSARAVDHVVLRAA